jgi:hypothetical protein
MIRYKWDYIVPSYVASTGVGILGTYKVWVEARVENVSSSPTADRSLFVVLKFASGAQGLGRIIPGGALTVVLDGKVFSEQKLTSRTQQDAIRAPVLRENTRRNYNEPSIITTISLYSDPIRFPPKYALEPASLTCEETTEASLQSSTVTAELLGEEVRLVELVQTVELRVNTYYLFASESNISGDPEAADAAPSQWIDEVYLLDERGTDGGVSGGGCSLRKY